MAKGTGGMKDLFLEKGEKIGLGVAAVLGVLFLAFGAMAMFSRPQDPDAFSKALDSKAQALQSKMGSPTAEIPPVPDEIKKAPHTGPLALQIANKPYYDPTPIPDSRRIAPNVLTVVEATADVAVVKVLANDFVLERDPS